MDTKQAARVTAGTLTLFLAVAAFLIPSSPPVVAAPSAPQSLKTNMVVMANNELSWWGNGGREECDSQETEARVQTYWSTVVSTQWSCSTSTNRKYWSAAFVSWVLKHAGAGPAFKYSARHSEYIRQAVTNKKTGNFSAPFVGERPEDYSPRVGDIVCQPRGKALDWVDYDTDVNYAAHCDLVVEANDGDVQTVGGNVSNSVQRTGYDTDPGGRLTDPRIHVVMRNTAGGRRFVGLGVTHGGAGYALVADTGETYAFGTVVYRGNPGIPPGTSIVDIDVTAGGKGYAAITDRGHVYAYGTVDYHGNPPIPADTSVVGIAVTDGGKGYAAITNQGHVYAYGTVQYHGNPPIPADTNIVDIDVTAGGKGYVAITNQGHVYAYGTVEYHGNPSGFSGSIVGIDVTGGGRGYAALSGTGQVYAYGTVQYWGNGDPD